VGSRTTGIRDNGLSMGVSEYRSMGVTE